MKTMLFYNLVCSREETSIPNETPCVAGVCLYRRLSTVHIPGKKETHHLELLNSQEDHKR